MRLVVTRAEPDASRTAARIDARGGTAILAPLLEIHATPGLDRGLSGVQALLFTSANGVRAFGDLAARVRVLAVGEATASEARSLGCADVTSAEGGGAALAALAQRVLDPAGGRVVHVSGAHIATDVAAVLRAAGFAAERRIAYEARAVSRLPLALANRLARPAIEIDRVLFHSARAAEIFTRLTRPEDAAPLTAVCLSEAVADSARHSPWARIVVAGRPREDAMLDAAFAP